MGHDEIGPDLLTIRNVLILGASGTLGAPTLQQLSRAGFEVTILTRPDSNATFPPGFNVVHAAYSDKIALSKVLENQDAVVFALGHVPPEIEPLLVDIAADVGVKRFILGEVSHNIVIRLVYGWAYWPVRKFVRSILADQMLVAALSRIVWI